MQKPITAPLDPATWLRTAVSQARGPSAYRSSPLPRRGLAADKDLAPRSRGPLRGSRAWSRMPSSGVMPTPWPRSIMRRLFNWSDASAGVAVWAWSDEG